MSHKVFAQVSVFALLLLAFLAVPTSALAGGACGGTYVVDAGDTLTSIASMCGIAVSTITTANPGVVDPLRTGQTLALSNTNSGGGSVTSTIVSSDTTYTNVNTNTSTNTNTNYNNYSAPVTYSNGTYIVQYGDTFSAIAYRYGLSVNQLWAANPQVWDINYLYAGQALYIPSSSGQTGNTSYAEDAESASYGRVPKGTPYGWVKMFNRSNGNSVSVSLQGTTREGVYVIYEYNFEESLTVKIPSGSYKYVAWSNQQQFVGNFRLENDGESTLKFFNSKADAN